MILQALKGYYDRVAVEDPTLPRFGYGFAPISYCLLLSPRGDLVDVEDLRELVKNTRRPRQYLVPKDFEDRTAGDAQPRAFWDKAEYIFGNSEKPERARRRFLHFRARHEDLFDGITDVGLTALIAFLSERVPGSPLPARLVGELTEDANIAFRLDGERCFIHERPAARSVWEASIANSAGSKVSCLVTASTTPIARIHPLIKNISAPGQPTPKLVSFDKDSDAYASFGKVEGANAPISELAAFSYAAALNHLLSRTSGRDAKDRPIYRNRVQIADATTVFWAEAADPAQAEASENLIAALFNPPEDGPADDDASATAKLGDVVKAMAAGRPLAQVSPGLAADTRFYLLGLSPNAARISVRFWHATTLGDLGAAFQQHWQDMRIEQPPARGNPPSVPACALMTAPARKDRQGRVKFAFDDVSPLLGGELMRAILTLGRYPASLLANLVMRVRCDGTLNRLRVALVKACIVRGMRLDGRLPKEDYLVRSDPDDPNPARRLGRLFALIERAQLAALGDDINATIKDKYIGAAAATPAQVFNGLVKNSFHHTGRLRRGHSEARWVKNPKPVGIAIERDIGRLWATFESGLPKQHTTEEQGLFFVGYFQERYGGKSDPNVGAEPGIDAPLESDDNDQE